MGSKEGSGPLLVRLLEMVYLRFVSGRSSNFLVHPFSVPACPESQGSAAASAGRRWAKAGRRPG